MKSNFIYFLLLGLLYSCVDRNFDEPPPKELVIPFASNSSIEQLKTKYIAGKATDIVDEINIVGVVIADDRTGNFYKSLVVQDSSGGIVVKVNRIGLYTGYPIGSKIGIKCKGLTIGDYGGLIQLGKGTAVVNGKVSMEFIPDNLVESFLFTGARNQVIVPKKLSINTVRSQDLSTLIEFENIEFSRSDVGKSIANVGSGSFVDLNLVDCSNSSILLHTSDFADFASYKVDSKNGNIVAVLGKFNQNVQLYLRDTAEIKFINAPCNSSGGADSLVTIKEIRKLFQGGSTKVIQKYKIRGQVISDKANSNIPGQNLFLQDETAGIVIRFTGNHSYALNQEIEIAAYNMELSEFNGLLQLNNVPLVNSVSTNSGISITPKLYTISEVNTNFENLESTLITIKGVSLSKTTDSKYSFNVVANDNSGTINLYTSPSAVFSNTNFPTGIVDLTVIVSEFNGKQILLRNLNDVKSNNGGGNTEVKSIREIRNLFQGSLLTIAQDYIIKAIVISERNALNIVSQNIVIQDSSAGITVRFVGNHTFNLGDLVEVKVKGIELSEFNGLLQLNNTPLLNASFISSNNSIIPLVVTIQDVLLNSEQLEGQLVKLQNVTISKASGTTLSGTCILSDTTGMLDLFTRSQATFAGTTLPVGPVGVTGIVSQFTKVQIIVRLDSDIKP